MNYTDPRFIKIAQRVFEEQFRRDPKLDKEMDERRKSLMYDDVMYNISFLLTAIHFGDPKIFSGYARWLFELLCNLMKDLDRDRISEQMTQHYSILSEALTDSASELMGEDELVLAREYLKLAAEETADAVTKVPLSASFMEGDYYDVRKQYLDALLTNRTKKAHETISSARKKGIPLEIIYEEILAKVMYEIGSLWHRNIITVDKEHYATSVTQTVMSSFYDEIFSKPRRNRTLVSCAVGNELHEMGIRMLSDVLEMNGWDTIYLGAALPEAAILEALKTHQPALVALSVTMPPYLSTCERVVQAIRSKLPGIKIAVGGQAFVNTSELWEKWDIDFFSTSASALARWARENLDN